jgi:two-component system, response regulator RegA
MNETKKTILVVDDDEIWRNRLERSLSQRGYLVTAAEDIAPALQLAENQKFDLAIIDLKMPGGSGRDLLIKIVKLQPDIRAVLLTGYGSIANAVDAIKLGAVDYVTKPADADQVLHALGEIQQRTPMSEIDIAPPSLAEAEWEHIQRVLSDCGGNISEAARVLDIPRRTLQRKLKKLAP